MQIDKDLLQYCKDNDFPIDEMVFEDFITVQNSLNFKCYKARLGLRDLGKAILNTFNNICKVFMNIWSNIKNALFKIYSKNSTFRKVFTVYNKTKKKRTRKKYYNKMIRFILNYRMY